MQTLCLSIAIEKSGFQDLSLIPGSATDWLCDRGQQLHAALSAVDPSSVKWGQQVYLTGQS